MTRQQVLDLYFLDARHKLIEIAAFLDRVLTRNAIWAGRTQGVATFERNEKAKGQGRFVDVQ